jgi:hypothetical protein
MQWVAPPQHHLLSGCQSLPSSVAACPRRRHSGRLLQRVACAHAHTHSSSPSESAAVPSSGGLREQRSTLPITRVEAVRDALDRKGSSSGQLWQLDDTFTPLSAGTRPATRSSPADKLPERARHKPCQPSPAVEASPLPSSAAPFTGSQAVSSSSSNKTTAAAGQHHCRSQRTKSTRSNIPHLPAGLARMLPRLGVSGRG